MDYSAEIVEKEKAIKILFLSPTAGTANYLDFESELRQILGPQPESTLAGLPIKAELFALAYCH